MKDGPWGSGDQDGGVLAPESELQPGEEEEEALPTEARTHTSKDPECPPPRISAPHPSAPPGGLSI